MSKNKGRQKTTILELNDVIINSYNTTRSSTISNLDYNFYTREDFVTVELCSESQISRTIIEFKAGIVDKDIRALIDDANRDKRFKITIEEI